MANILQIIDWPTRKSSDSVPDDVVGTENRGTLKFVRGVSTSKAVLGYV